MNVTQVGEIHNCDCGFSWRTGKSGSHECGYGLRKQLADLKAQCNALAAENASIKANVAVHAAGFSVCPVCSHEEPCETDDIVWMVKAIPATDAYLNSVRAEGVEMFSKELGSPYGDGEDQGYETGFNRALEVSKSKAAKFVTQLRASKDGV